MSKGYGNTVEIFAPEKKLRKQVMGIVTDSTPVADPKDPSQPLFVLWNLVADEAGRAEVKEAWKKGGMGYGDLKKRLAARVLEVFCAARERREALGADPDAIEDILSDGARRTRASAAPVLAAVREAAGIGPPRR